MQKHLVFGVIGFLIVFAWGIESIAQSNAPFGGFGEILYHRAAINGTAQWTESELIGSDVDLDATIGLEKTHGIGGKAGLVLYNAHEFIVDFRRYATSEDAELDTTIRFGGVSIPSFLPVSPSLKFQSIGGFYGFRIVNTSVGFLSIRPGVELVEYEVSIDVDVPLVVVESPTYGEEYVIPFLWLAGEAYLHPMASIAGELIGGWQNEQTAYWGQGLLKFHAHPNISALFGYSRVWFSDETKDNEFEVTLSGLVIGVQASW